MEGGVWSAVDGEVDARILIHVLKLDGSFRKLPLLVEKMEGFKPTPTTVCQSASED